MSVSESEFQPVDKKYSLIDDPETGEHWPEGMDSITVRQRASRMYKAKEARRNLDYFFEVPIERDSDYLYGVLWHFEENETHGLVMIDRGNAYMRSEFICGKVVGSQRYGYQVCDSEVVLLSGDRGYSVEEGDYLTYFKVPFAFKVVEGELLGMMIGTMRDRLTNLAR